jgi:poly-gamma-glutamate synthesis protein (capsule biosynthesis protein)
MLRPFYVFLLIGAGFLIVGLALLVQQTTQTTIDPIVETRDTSVEQVAETAPTTLLFGGDLMFDRDIRLTMNKHGVDFILKPLTTVFNEYDIVVANLEGPVTNFNSDSVGSVPNSHKNFIFTFDPLIIPMLQANNIQLVNLGNNHITNFGSNGITETKLHLNQNQLSFFGNTGTESKPSERVIVKNVGDMSPGTEMANGKDLTSAAPRCVRDSSGRSRTLVRVTRYSPSRV